MLLCLHVPARSGYHCVLPNTVSKFKAQRLELGKMVESACQTAASEH